MSFLLSMLSRPVPSSLGGPPGTPLHSPSSPLFSSILLSFKAQPWCLLLPEGSSEFSGKEDFRAPQVCVLIWLCH